MDGSRSERAGSVHIDADVLAEARRRHVPVEAVARRAIEKAVRDSMSVEERAAISRTWLRENAEALRQLREWDAAHPLPLADIQVLQIDAEEADTLEEAAAS